MDADILFPILLECFFRVNALGNVAGGTLQSNGKTILIEQQPADDLNREFLTGFFQHPGCKIDVIRSEQPAHRAHGLHGHLEKFFAGGMRGKIRPDPFLLREARHLFNGWADICEIEQWIHDPDRVNGILGQ